MPTYEDEVKKVIQEMHARGCTQRQDCVCSVCAEHYRTNPHDGCSCGCEGDIESHRRSR